MKNRMENIYTNIYTHIKHKAIRFLRRAERKGSKLQAKSLADTFADKS